MKIIKHGSFLSRNKWCFFALLLLVMVNQGQAQSSAKLMDPGQKSSQMVRTSTVPVIDGVLNEEVWQHAAMINNLHQVNPVEYAQPSERTEISLLYDDDALYVGVRLYMSDEAEITSNVLRQGANINIDDTFYITLDPFNTQRSGYFFGVNPNGVRADGLYRNVSEFYGNWDSIYYVQTSVFEGGWAAEFKIPFKSFSFDSTSDTWGLNFSRSIKSRNEDIAWVTRNRRWDPSSSGLATGFAGMDQGLGLDIVPTMSVNNANDFGSPGSPNSGFEPSLDIAYKVTPSLNASLTFNTDFSATEVDTRQVNLTRFGLFFPEKRDFFLREADIFEFGRIGAQSGSGGGQNGRPFFSRRIGLANNGEVVGLDFGAKVSGRIGRWEVGALSIREEEHLGIAADNLSVLRAKVALGGESTLGAIFTEGNPNENVNNRLGGIDYLYRNSKFLGGKIIEISAWYQQSDTDEVSGDESAAGIGFSIPSNTGIRGGAGIRRFEANFNPALGFVTRKGITNSSFDLGYTYRPETSIWQSMLFTIDAERYTEIEGGALQSERFSVTPIKLISRKGDSIFLRSNFKTEVLTSSFTISPGVAIPAGKYDFNDHGIEFTSATHRKVAASITYIRGDFYDGERVRFFGDAAWQPSPKIRATVGFDVSDIELSAGNFTTRIITAGLDYVFSPTLSWVNLVQYDNVSNTAGLNMRLHWVPESGRDVFFVVNHVLEDYDQNDRFHSAESNATVKLSYTLRY